IVQSYVTSDVGGIVRTRLRTKEQCVLGVSRTRVGADTGNGDASPEEGEVRFISRQPSDLDLPPSGKAWCAFQRWPRVELPRREKIIKTERRR
ncbi:hypothetical protein V1478_014650, partial [Vespula squamosa]